MHEVIVLISSRLMRSSDDLIWNLLSVPQAGNPRHSPLSYVCVFPSPYLSPLFLSIIICVCVSLPASLSSLSLHYHHTLAGLTTVNHSITFESCSTTVLCYSPEDEGKCSIRYGLNSYNQDPTISGSLKRQLHLTINETQHTVSLPDKCDRQLHCSVSEQLHHRRVWVN